MTDNISVFEEYLFATDKTEFLESCRNASEIKQYIRLCHLLSHPEAKLEKEDRDLLERWKAHYNHGDKGALVLKDALTAILNEGDATKRQVLMMAFNQQYLGFSFNDSRGVTGSQTQTTQDGEQPVAYKTSLDKTDLDEMLTSTKLNELLNSETGHISFQPQELELSILAHIDFSKVRSWPVKENLFNFLPDFATSQVVLSHSERSACLGRVQRVSEKQGQEPVQLAAPRIPAGQTHSSAAGLARRPGQRHLH